jgi:hypothetical protein
MAYTKEQMDEAAGWLEACKHGQRQLWEAAFQLEQILGFDVDTTQDLEGLDLDELIAIKS